MDPTQARMIERVGEGILQVAQAEERKLDAQIKEMENLDEDDFEALRQKRRLMLQQKTRQDQDWQQLGHGRGVTPRCEIVHAHFERLAPNHLETRFVKINAEKSPYLVEKLGIILMPTIVLIRDGKTEHSLRGFDELGGTDDFTTDDMAYVLSTHKVLNFEVDRSEALAQNASRSGLNHIGINRIKASTYDNLSDDDDYN